MNRYLTPRVAFVGLVIALTPLFLTFIVFPAMHRIMFYLHSGEAFSPFPATSGGADSDAADYGYLFVMFLPTIAAAVIFAIYLLGSAESWFDSFLSSLRSSRRRVLWYLGAAFSISIFSWGYLLFMFLVLGNSVLEHAYLYSAISVALPALLFIYLLARKSPLKIVFTVLYVFLVGSLFGLHTSSFPIPHLPSTVLNAYAFAFFTFTPFFDRRYFSRDSPVLKSLAISLILIFGILFSYFLLLALERLPYISQVIPIFDGAFVAYGAFLAALFFQILALAWVVVDSDQHIHSASPVKGDKAISDHHSTVDSPSTLRILALIVLFLSAASFVFVASAKSCNADSSSDAMDYAGFFAFGALLASFFLALLLVLMTVCPRLLPHFRVFITILLIILPPFAFAIYFPIRLSLFAHKILMALAIVPILIVFALNAIRRFLPWPALLAAISLSAFYPTTMMNFEGAYLGGCTNGAVAFILTSALFAGYLAYARKYRTKSAFVAAALFALFFVAVYFFHALHVKPFSGGLALFYSGYYFAVGSALLVPIIPFISSRYLKSASIILYLAICAVASILGYRESIALLLFVLLPLIVILEPIAVAKSILMDFEQKRSVRSPSSVDDYS